MKKIIIMLSVILFAVCLPLTAVGEEDYLSEIYRQSGADRIEDSLGDTAKEFFESENIDPADYNWVNSLKAENVFSHIWTFVKSGAKEPFRAGFILLAIILLAAAVRAFKSDSQVDASVKLVVTLAACGTIIYGVFGSINSAVNAIKGTGSFMMAFVPVYMGIMSVSGAPISAASSGGMLLFAAEFTGGAAAFLITALMGAYLAVSISAGVSPLLSGTGLSDVLKKSGMWIMSFCTTVFLGVLTAQNAVNTAADSLSVRTARFILGTCVPVAGTALSGAVKTVSSSLSLLKSSVGIYGVVALAVMLLPIFAELLLWRLVLTASGAVCKLFSIEETSKLFKAVDGMLAFLLGVLALVAATFIISLSVCISAGGAV